ncbi:MAG: AAA family ATPase, partial [Candidatus Rokuibacteriota bacterium]
PESLQGKLLKVIEEKTVRRLGSTRSEAVDVWVIAASSADLLDSTRDRRFREDLYHRLAVVTVSLPPLRDRGDDILMLAEHFLQRACREYGLPSSTLDAAAREALLAYDWPGNIREISNVMERVALLAETAVVTRDMLGLPAPRGLPAARERPALREELSSVERDHLLEALRESNGNLSRAAERLGIPRNTLRYRLDKYGLRAGAPGPAGPRPGPAAMASAPAAKMPASSGIRWEPRRLTLLRAALVPISPDRALPVSRALEVVDDKVRAFGGRVEERSPTGLVAAFGMEPVEDAPRRAAHAAMAVQKAAERARAEGEAVGVKLAIHVGRFQVGLGSGTAEIALEAKHGAWAALDALLARVDADTVVVSDSAAPFLERRFDLAPVAAAPGSSGRAYRLVEHERPGLGVGRRMAAFVGRRKNVDVLKGHLAAAMRGQGQVIGIVGEAGIGKSRLIAEFRQSLAGQPVTYREGTCFSYASATPYVPVLAILRQNCGITESDAAETIITNVRRALERVGMNVEEWAPYLLELFGVHEGTDRLAVLTPEAIRLRTVETLRQMILNASHEWPLVVVVEDLHWIDKTSENVFASLVTDLPGAPIMFVSTYRPGYRPPWIDKSFATQMALSPLSPEDSLTMMRSVLQTEIPDPLVRMILTKAEGNPFFLEELCRAVEEQGNLNTAPGVPDTIEEVLSARIERLPDEPRRVLQTAAVLGRQFSSRLLQALWEGTDALDAHLGLLTGLEFLYRRAAGEERLYVFKHALTQEVAYASLPGARRQALHAAAGRALEALFGDRLEEAYDRLAYHYSKTDETAKAVEYLTRVAEKAAGGYAHEEALQAWKEALQHVERLPVDTRDRRHLELVLQLPYSLLALGRIAELHAVLLQERDRLERLQDPALAAHYYFLVARAYIFVGGHDLAVENGRRAIAEAERSGDEATMGKAHSVLALADAMSGQASRGIEHGQRAVTLLEKTKEQSWLCYAYWALGLCYSQTSAFPEALAAEARALAIAEATGDQQEAHATWVMGIVHAAMGEWDQGITECQRAVEKTRDALNRAIATGYLGFACLEKGDTQRAITALEQSIPFLHQVGFRAFEGWFTAFLAQAHCLEGRLDRAEVLAGDAVRIGTEARFGVAIGWAQQALGRVARARGDLAGAAAKLEEALETFASVHSRYERARTHIDLATVRWQGGEREAARRHLDEAHTLFKTLEVPRYRERVEQLAGQWGMPLVPARRA